MAASMKSRKCLRKKRNSSGSSDEDSEKIKPGETLLSDIKELQKSRSRQHGVSAESLAEGREVRQKRDVSINDPLKMKTGGGMVDMKELKKGKLTDDDGEAIGTAFAAETNRRDEDTEMLRYVEEELSKKKGTSKDDEPAKHERKKSDELYVIPENLASESKLKRKEGTISSQMLSGIPEIDLGIEAKISNIEKTEEAKHQLMMERMRKKDDRGSKFIPTNMAVNFVQHNRFNVEDTLPTKKGEEPAPKAEPLRVGDAEKYLMAKGSGKRTTEKATDDEIYNKFTKKQRY